MWEACTVQTLATILEQHQNKAPSYEACRGTQMPSLTGNTSRQAARTAGANATLSPNKLDRPVSFERPCSWRVIQLVPALHCALRRTALQWAGYTVYSTGVEGGVWQFAFINSYRPGSVGCMQCDGVSYTTDSASAWMQAYQTARWSVTSCVCVCVHVHLPCPVAHEHTNIIHISRQSQSLAHSSSYPCGLQSPIHPCSRVYYENTVRIH